MIIIAIAIVLLCKYIYPSRLLEPMLIHNNDTALLLAGCSSSSPQMPNIFLIDFYYHTLNPVFNSAQVNPAVTAALASIVGRAMLEVRVGYFGICITPDGSNFLCGNNATLLANQLSIDQDPMNLIWIANKFKNDVVFPYLM